MCVLGASMLMAGCDGPRISDENIKYVNDYGTLKAYMEEKSRKPVVLLDPRPARRYEREHAAGTINVPINLLRNGDPDLAKAKTVIVIAGGFDDYIGAAAVKTMLEMGYKNIYEFRGGLEAWKRAGGAVGTGPDPRLAPQPEFPATQEIGPAQTLDVFVPERGLPPNF
jgi:rhodanese-related sulfurtransferase